MQSTYYGAPRWLAHHELAPEETQNIPFFGFVTGTLISLGLWGVIAVVVWAVAA